MRAENEDGVFFSTALVEVNGFLLPGMEITKNHFITSLLAIICVVS